MLLLVPVAVVGVTSIGVVVSTPPNANTIHAAAESAP
jgi:hypothetical protein